MSRWIAENRSLWSRLGKLGESHSMAMEPGASGPARQWKLPPLILHPFSDANGPSKLVESSRASLMLQGLLPSGQASAEELNRRLLDGRFCELRMLYYVGKDVLRWIEQCLEWAQSQEELRALTIRFQSFASLLIDNPPQPVKEKLKSWGVADYKAIFSRAIGLNSLFRSAPQRDDLAEEFILNYYRYTDQLFLCRQRSSTFAELDATRFDFDLYASGEYTRMLEREWSEP